MSLAEPADYNMLPVKGEAQASPGPSTGFAENAGAVFDSVFKVHSQYALTEMWQEELQKRDDLIHELTGNRPGVHYTAPEFVEQYRKGVRSMDAVTGDSLSPATQAIRKNYEYAVDAENRIGELRKAYPQIKSREDIMKDISARRAAIQGKAADVTGRANALGIVGGFAGGMAGSMTTRSPVNLATLPFGGFGKTAIKRIGTEAVVQGAIAGVDEAFVAQDFKRMGEEVSAGQVGVNLLFAAGGGAFFRGLIEGGGAIYSKLAKKAEEKTPAGRLAQELIDVQESWKRAAILRQADPEAVAEIHDIVNPVQSAAQRGAVQAAELEQFTANENPFKDGEVKASQAHADMISKVHEAVETQQPLPEGPQSIAQLSDDIYKRVPVRTYDIEALTVDAPNMQFKEGGDAEGVTDRLKGTKDWSDYLAGVITVWERKDGTVVVADGHQRVGFAKRIMASDPEKKISIPAFVFKGSEGDSQAFVRAAAALRNIGEGSGTALDASKVFRDMPSRAKAVFDSLPPNSQLVKQGLSLAKLDNEAFSMVVNGVVDEKIAAVVGRLEDDFNRQRALMALLAKEEPDTIFQAEEIVRQAQQAGFETSEQATLFGSESVTETLFKDKAKVLERGLRMIRDDIKTFRNLLNKGERIAEAGNQLNQSANAAILGDANTILQTVQALAYRKGPVSDLLTIAAKEAKGNGRYKPAAQRFVAALRERLDEGGVSKLFDGSEGDLSAAIAEVSGRSKSEDIAATIENVHDLFESRQKNIAGEFDRLRQARDVQAKPAERNSSAEAGKEPESKPISASGAGTQDLLPESQRTAFKPPSEEFSTAKIDPDTLTGGKAKLGIRDSSNNAVLYHAINNKAKLIDRAKHYNETIGDWLGGLVSDIRGAKFVGSRVKAVKDIDNKINMLGRRADQVSDYLGARIQVDSIRAAHDVRNKIAETAHIIEVDDFMEVPRSGGAYRAIHMQAVTKDGFTYEIQIIPRDLMDVYDAARKPYADWKGYRGSIPAEKKAAYIKDRQKGNALFDDAWKKFLQRDELERQIDEFNVDDTVPISIEFDEQGNEIIKTIRLGDIMQDIELHEQLLDNMTKCAV